MQTDDEVIERLRRASSMVRAPDDPTVRLFHRRSVRRRRERLAAGVLGMALFVGVAGASLFAIRGVSSDRPVGPASGGVVPTGSPSIRSLGPGEYFYLQTQIVLSPQGKVRIETWWATDGSGRIAAMEYEDAQYGLPPEGTFGPGEFPIESDVSDLPTDPAALYEELLGRSARGGASPQPEVSPGGPGQTRDTGPMWRAVKRLLEYPNALPELRAALIQLAHRIPGVTILRGVKDPVGRPADAIELTIEDATDAIFFDPQTLQPLGISSSPVEDPEAETYEVFLEGIVPSPEDRPTGEQWLTPEPV
jgi:hypothetical protein